MTARQWAFAVTHVPENNDRAHSHIEIIAGPGNAGGKPKANDIRELVDMLIQRFGALETHDCAAAVGP
jgi:hypothetical protein